MKTVTENKKQSLLADAFEVLLDNLGPEKTAELWRIFISPEDDYLKIRSRIFADKNISSIYGEAKKFNRRR